MLPWLSPSHSIWDSGPQNGPQSDSVRGICVEHIELQRGSDAVCASQVRVQDVWPLKQQHRDAVKL